MGATNLDEVIEFLQIVEKQGHLNDNTAQSRRTACVKFFEVLEPDQRSVEYVRDNLDVVKARFGNLNKDVRGQTVEVYAKRVRLTLKDFEYWKTDRAGWERDAAARGGARAANGDTERKTRSAPRAEKKQTTDDIKVNSNARVMSFPLRPDFEMVTHLPLDGITRLELHRIGLFLSAFVKDFGAAGSPKMAFPDMLESQSQEDPSARQ